MIAGTQTGVCVAVDAATQAGSLPADKANELISKAVERIRSSPKAQALASSPEIKGDEHQGLRRAAGRADETALEVAARRRAGLMDIGSG
jgi:F0F1-type ATP synthase epsilon subunit